MDKLIEYLDDSTYRLYNCTGFNLIQIQELLKECRIDSRLILYIEKTDSSREFFENLKNLKLDRQDSNYFIAHTQNYATWVGSHELSREKLLEFLDQSHAVHKFEDIETDDSVRIV